MARIGAGMSKTWAMSSLPQQPQGQFTDERGFQSYCHLQPHCGAGLKGLRRITAVTSFISKGLHDSYEKS